METKINAEYLEKIWNNKQVRQRLAYESPFWFSMFYLRRHFNYPLAPFHMEMFHLIEQSKYEFIVVMAFRESGKSTIMNLSNVLWSILGKPGKKCVIIMSQTQDQAKNHFANIKSELEGNELLKEDFGPFTENTNEWNRLSLELEYHGAKIMSVTRDQKVRGVKFNQHRPDLIICDDLEDSVSVKDRTATEEFAKIFESEILPLGNEYTKIIVLGNLLSHYWIDQDMNRSFILRLKNQIEDGRADSVFRAYPLIDDRGKNLWPSRFPDRKAVLKLRLRLSLETWIQEYLLKSYGQDDKNGPNINFESSFVIQKIREESPNFGKRNFIPVQKPLIQQMKKYMIRAPMHDYMLFKNPDDPEYTEFLRKMYFYPNNEDLQKRIVEDGKRYAP